MNIYILSMERNGNREEHHYNCGLYTDLAKACIEGLEHEDCRAGKYEMRIELAAVDDDVFIITAIPREVCINYAVLKFPARFNDRKQLIEEQDKAEV